MEALDDALAAGLAGEEEEQENERMFTCVGFRLMRKALLLDCITRTRCTCQRKRPSTKKYLSPITNPSPSFGMCRIFRALKVQK